MNHNQIETARSDLRDGHHFGVDGVQYDVQGKLA